MGTSSVYSSSSSVSNTGQMSTSIQKTGATGAVKNVNNFTSVQGKNGAPGKTTTTTVRTQGDPEFQLGQESEVIKSLRQYFGL